ncbi:outer dense fiber protein 2-like isoform 3-T3 [Pholidichthys leucotaenia]
MKTRDSPPSPPPVHVHVPETTPVHVYMRRSPNKTPQSRSKEVQVNGKGGKQKVRTPWIPPGRLSCRRGVGSYQSQTNKAQSERGDEHRCDAEEEDEEEEELVTVSKNLSIRCREDIHCLNNSYCLGQHREIDALLRALVEAEIDGVAVANQLTALKETIDDLSKNKRLSKLHTASLGRQQQLLLEKIEMFDHTNQSLRQLLREWSEHQKESLVLSEQKDDLKKRLADSKAENIRLLTRLTNKEKEASKLAERLDFEKDNVKTTEELSRILESTRDHLESQLNRTEAEKVQLAAQVQKMHQSHGWQQEELQTLQKELQTLRQQREDEEGRQDQETLSRLTQQAERAEEATRQLAEKLQEKESQLSQALSTSSDWYLRHSKEAAAKEQLEKEIDALKSQVTELHSQLHLVNEKNQAEREEVRDQLHHLSTENASAKLENQRLKGELTSSEKKLRGLHSEARQLKSSIKKYESLVEKYQKKVEQQGAHLEMLQQRNLLLQEENDILAEKIHNLEKKLEDMNAENKEMSQALTLKDASIRGVQQQLEEKSRECRVLTTQLQQILDNAEKQQMDDSMQRLLAKERVSQSKALDLQTQLSRAKTELSQLQRNKEETEHCFQRQLQSMKERLEQSDSTNRSLQNYVHFLKTSYRGVLRDSLPAS